MRVSRCHSELDSEDLTPSCYARASRDALELRKGGHQCGQFRFLRSAIIGVVLFGAAVVTGASLRPKNPGTVVVRSVLYGVAIVMYFAAIGSLPVAIGAAGLFMAPIFILIFSTLIFRQPVGLYRICAVIIGFVGVLVIMRPFGQSIEPLAIVPVIAAVFYALAMLVTSHKCQDEDTMCLVFWFR